MGFLAGFDNTSQDPVRPPSPARGASPTPSSRASSPSRMSRSSPRARGPVEPKCIGQITVTVGFGIISLPNYGLTSFEGLGVQPELTVRGISDICKSSNAPGSLFAK